MSNGYTGLLMQCPFYSYDKPMLIACECGMLRFLTQPECKRYACTYCADEKNWKRCTMAQARLVHYEEDKNDRS